jgi:pyruvate carboxylase
VVGDLALYMLTHNLTPEDVLQRGAEIQFPESVVGLFAGEIGYPAGGFPADLQQAVLKGRQPVEGRLGEHLPPVDFKAQAKDLAAKIDRKPTEEDVLSWLMYPRVFQDFAAHRRKFSDVSAVPTPAFFYGMEPGEETSVEIEEGKTLFIKLIARTVPDEQGQVTLFYELNGHPREVKIADRAATASVKRHPKADPDNMHHVGAPMPGAVVEVAVKPGQEVEKDAMLIAMEAMKVQMYVNSPVVGKVKEVLVQPGSRIDTNDLLIVFE